MQTLRARALVAAAGLVLTACASGGTGSSERTDTPVTPTEDPTSSATSSVSPRSTTTALTDSTPVPLGDAPTPVLMHPDGLRRGDEPRITYEIGRGRQVADQSWLLVRPDGSTLDLGSIGTDFAPMGDGLVGVLTGEVSEAFVVDGSGKVVRREPMRGYRLAASPDGSIVGWLDVHGTPQVVEAGGRRTWSMPRVDKGVEIGAILGTRTCKEGLDGSGCSVFVNGARGSFVSVSHGFVDIVPRVRQIEDANAAVGVAATVASNPGCSGVQSWAGRWRWQTCDYLLQRFAPGGRRIVGTDGPETGYELHRVGIFSRTGRLIVAFRTPTDTWIRQLAWEDRAHLLAVVHADRAWYLLRLGADGSRERVLGPRRGGALNSPFILPTR